MKMFERVRNKIKGGLRLHHRMILIYVVGGMIPFISANRYFFYLRDAVKTESWYKPTIKKMGMHVGIMEDAGQQDRNICRLQEQ